MAKLTERLYAVADGDIYPRWFEVGEEVTGQVEKSARSRGIVEDDAPKKRKLSNKAARALENK